MLRCPMNAVKEILRMRVAQRPVAECMDCGWAVGPYRETSVLLGMVRAHVRATDHQVFTDKVERTTYWAKS